MRFLFSRAGERTVTVAFTAALFILTASHLSHKMKQEFPLNTSSPALRQPQNS